MAEALIFIAIIFVIWLLSEFWQIILPIIGAIIALIIIICIWSKKSESNEEKNYINHPTVKKELDECFERVKILHSTCQHNDGYIIISRANYGTFDYNESEYKHDYPRVYAKFEFIGSYPLEVYKKACYTGDYEQQLWAEKELAKSIFNISVDELKNGVLKNYYGSLLSDAKYSNFDYEMIMVMYIYPPSVEGIKLTQEIRCDYFTNKLERMYKEYLQQQKPPRN